MNEMSWHELKKIPKCGKKVLTLEKKQSTKKKKESPD